MAHVRINSAKLEAKVFSFAHAASRRGANRVALRARASVLGQNRIDTHEMIRSFRVEDRSVGTRRAVHRVFNTAPHYRFQELGTGTPPGVGRIYPKRARVLRFKPKGGTVFVFARSVRGVKPGEFLKRAAAATQLKDFSDGPLEFSP